MERKEEDKEQVGQCDRAAALHSLAAERRAGTFQPAAWQQPGPPFSHPGVSGGMFYTSSKLVILD